MSLATVSAPWQNVNMPALDLRRFLMTLVSAEGVRLADDLKVSQRAAGANMSVDIAAGLALVLGDSVAFQGPYVAYNDAVVNLTGFAAADATNPRVDRVVLEVRDAFHGGAANDMRFQILTGTPTAGATLANLSGAAAVGSNRLLLANVLIPAGSTSITDANIDTSVRSRVTPAGAGSTKLAEIALTGSQATIDFTSIPAGYRHLEIVWQLRSDRAALAEDYPHLRFNNDAGANYDFIGTWMQSAQADPSKTGGVAQTAAQFAMETAVNATGDQFAVGTLRIPDYRGARRKGFSGDFFLPRSGGAADQYIGEFGGLWRSTAVIDRITLLNPGAGANFVAGSVVTLYGLV